MYHVPLEGFKLGGGMKDGGRKWGGDVRGGEGGAESREREEGRKQ